MKKLVALLLAGLMGVACVACSSTNSKDNTDNTENKDNNKQEVTIKDANEILTTVWDKFENEDSDDDMYNDKFAVIGGHFENPVDNAPGKYDVSKAEDLEFNLCVPQDAISKIDDAASMIHMMNANTFTAGAFHVKEASDLSAFVDAVKERTLGNQWMCGFPDQLLIVTIGDNYVVSAFGNADTIKAFKTVLMDEYADAAKVAVEEALN